MRNISLRFAVVGAGAGFVLALAGAGPAAAEIVPWKADLSGEAEVPPNDSAGTGQFEGSFDTETRTLAYTITYSGLTGPITAAHVHGPAIPGKTAPVMLPILGTPDNPIKGTATLSPEQADTLKRGVYVNLHTAAHPDGELRGELK